MKRTFGRLPSLERSDALPLPLLQARARAAQAAFERASYYLRNARSGLAHMGWKRVRGRIKIELEHLEAVLRKRVNKGDSP